MTYTHLFITCLLATACLKPRRIQPQQENLKEETTPQATPSEANVLATQVENGSPTVGGPAPTEALEPTLPVAVAAQNEPEVEKRPTKEPTEPVPIASYPKEDEFLKLFPSGDEQLKILCARRGQDKVRAIFCSTPPPVVKNLKALQDLLGIGFPRPGPGRNGTDGNAAFAITGHSSSLVVRSVNAINPRAIIFTPPGSRRIDFMSMGFARGEQFVELATRDASDGSLKFFLVSFKQACNDNPTGHCKVGELLAPDIEKAWTSVSIYEDIDLKNTVADCLQCHQPAGPGTPKMLRMQELRDPWTHFFSNRLPSGQAVLADFQAAHGEQEDFAGIPANMVASADAALLEELLKEQGFTSQPNEFKSPEIEKEVQESSPGQPKDNTVPGSSKTWDLAFDAFVRGEVIPPPYHDAKVTDPAKLALLTKAYQDYRSGILAASQLPDLRDAFSTSALRGSGLMVKEGLDGEGIIRMACSQCHHAKLDQSLTRARFTFVPGKMSRQTKDIAIMRLSLPRDHLNAMPPLRFRYLSDDEIQKAISYLKQ